MKKTIRILQVIGKMDRAGAETLIMNIYRNIDREKIQFDFVVHDTEEGDFDQEIKKLGGKIYYAPRYKIYNSISYKKFWIDFLKKHKEYNIIHGHIRSCASIYLKVAKENKIYTICHSHATKNKGIRGILYQILTKDIKKYTNYFFGCSTNAIIDAFGKRVAQSDNSEVLYNAIDTNSFKYNEKISKEYKKKLNLENKYIIGHIGRLSPEKNHKFLIDVFEKIVKERKNSVLVLVGKGPLESNLKEYAKNKNILDKVIFLGIRDDIASLLMMFDVFVFPSIYEGLGISLVEAQASGLKCIASDSIQDEAIITNNVTRLSLKDSIENWKNNILKIKKGYRRTIEKNTKINKYNINEVTKHIEKFYLTRVKK